MPELNIEKSALEEWGKLWQEKQSFGRKQSMDFGKIFDLAVGKALAVMLGGLLVETPKAQALKSASDEVVEVGPVRLIGGIRPQNYDVGYRPDGARFAFDSKTLNDASSVGKNFQNMVNDLGTEAMTVHTRFPHCVVAFMVVIPAPCLSGDMRKRFTQMLDRLVGRKSAIDEMHKAEAISLVLWDPNDGTIDPDWPISGSLLRIEKFSEQVQLRYHERYEGLAPHDKPSKKQREALKAKGEPIPEPAAEDTTVDA